ncbi:MAG: sigma-70 family RNA polymerase sigma factor [Gemmatales bacterium]|nr:sigma-70 family RNA polymerase sigma factor [Gemmatales bacterium]MDW8387560.1 sigma-70 family RNA polymerase sigma factor [Gemmatales bacterium]
MKKRSNLTSQRNYVAALLVGTALWTLGTSTADAAVTRALFDMTRYCTVCWKNARLQPDYWPDCTQEVLTRVLERLSPDRWQRVLAEDTEERREFLRAIDAVKKRTQRAHRPGSLDLEVADSREDRNESIREIRSTILQAAEKSLSPRQMHIIQLTLDGWSVAEIAREMDLPAARISDEKYKAIQRLRSTLAHEM